MCKETPGVVGKPFPYLRPCSRCGETKQVCCSDPAEQAEPLNPVCRDCCPDHGGTDAHDQ